MTLFFYLAIYIIYIRISPVQVLEVVDIWEMHFLKLQNCQVHSVIVMSSIFWSLIL
jgi:hypothetical protein